MVELIWTISFNEFFDKKIVYRRTKDGESLKIMFREKVLDEDGDLKEVITWDSIEFGDEDLDEFIRIIEYIKKERDGRGSLHS